MYFRQQLSATTSAFLSFRDKTFSHHLMFYSMIRNISPNFQQAKQNIYHIGGEAERLLQTLLVYVLEPYTQTPPTNSKNNSSSPPDSVE